MRPITCRYVSKHAHAAQDMHAAVLVSHVHAGIRATGHKHAFLQLLTSKHAFDALGGGPACAEKKKRKSQAPHV